MSGPLDPEVPPAGEEIHLPGPSIQPLLLAFGIMIALLGTTLFFPAVIAGSVLSLVVTVWWIRDTRREMDELPLDHH